VTENLSLNGSVAWINAETNADTTALGAAKGDQLPNTPEWQAVLSANYDFTLGDLPAFARASWRYKGDMPVGFEGYTDASGMVVPPAAPRVELDSYQLVDLQAGLSLGAFDFSVYVTNLFDEWAYTGFSPTFAGIPSGTPTRPRTVGGVVRWNFR
jgi:iron complex outermembrane receptor protein